MKLEWAKKVMGKLEKYKYPLLMLVLGLGILLFPSKEPATHDSVDTTPVQVQEIDPLQTMQAELSALLSKIQGAGRVEVMLQYESSEQTLYQSDIVQEQSESSTKSTSQTVLQGEGKTPIVTKTIYPTYSGAIILAEGADNAQLRWELVTSVSALTGLGADRISVIKMEIE